jgi:hypothetical protein
MRFEVLTMVKKYKVKVMRNISEAQMMDELHFPG